MNEVTRDKYLTEAELNRLNEVFDKFPNDRDTTMLKLALAIGVRPAELLAIHLDDLNPSSQSIYIRTKKGGRDRELPIFDQVLFDNLYHLALNSPSKKPFPISKTQLFRIWDQYRVGGKKLYCLRHTAAIRIYKQTLDVKVVQKFLGHRSMMNTMVYIDFEFSFEEFRDKLRG